uniref:KIB1-4 beta-propeller domain-containing protein n=1 Tax=Oryza sativa subsp. japonica TaxID=39947 RepID=Q6H5N1_ORYSJ|nr:hypothetical protein [Oryza sativa Japonica Group]
MEAARGDGGGAEGGDGQMAVVQQSLAVVGRAGDRVFVWVSFQDESGAVRRSPSHHHHLLVQVRRRPPLATRTFGLILSLCREDARGRRHAARPRPPPRDTCSCWRASSSASDAREKEMYERGKRLRDREERDPIENMLAHSTETNKKGQEYSTLLDPKFAPVLLFVDYNLDDTHDEVNSEDEDYSIEDEDEELDHEDDNSFDEDISDNDKDDDKLGEAANDICKGDYNENNEDAGTEESDDTDDQEEDVTIFFYSIARKELLCKRGHTWFKHEYQSSMITTHENRRNVILTMKDLTAVGGRFCTYLSKEKAIVTLEFLPNPTFTTTPVKDASDPIYWYTTFTNCLLESCGELFMLSFKHPVVCAQKVVQIEVHKLDLSRRIWVKVNTIGNKAFLVECIGFGSSLTAEDVGLKRNCIYFVRPNDKGLYVYDMERGTTVMHNPGADLPDNMTLQIVVPPF